MRSEQQVIEFMRFAQQKFINTCLHCNGMGTQSCECHKQYDIALEKYMACIPRDFTDIDPASIKKNKSVFKKVIQKYVESIDLAHKKGYGLVLTGDNGVGKTYFVSYVLNKAIESGRKAYYVTALQLEHIIKTGFNDNKTRKRLEWMLESDFLAIDEFGKEKKKANERTFMDTQIERILKQRYDDSMPVLLCSNLSIATLNKIYGSTIGSILEGKSKIAQLSPGDFRATLSKKMNKEMEY